MTAALACVPGTAAAQPVLRPVSSHSFELVDDAGFADYPLAQLRELESESKLVSAQIAEELLRLLHHDPTGEVLVRFVSPAQFRKMTGELRWSGAVFVPGQILVPIRPNGQLSFIRRTLRHEYMHAALSELSAGRCPAWFEEGLAQLFEGGSEQRLSEALAAELREGGPLVLNSLSSSFRQVPEHQIRAAYAQSLFAVRSVVNRFGFGAIRTYLQLLRLGRSGDKAFAAAFGEPLADFEQRLHAQLSRWLAAGGSAI